MNNTNKLPMENMEEIYNLILIDSNLQAKLMLAMGKHYSTIYRWAKTKSIMLSTKIALDTVKKHLKSEPEIIETELSK